MCLAVVCMTVRMYVCVYILMLQSTRRYLRMTECECDSMWYGIPAGDCVYVRSDQEKPFVARIDRMWTDTK